MDLSLAQAYSTVTRYEKPSSRFMRKLSVFVMGAFCGFVVGFLAGVIVKGCFSA